MAESIAEANPQTFSKQPILENAIYDREEAANVTGFSLSTLIRAEEKQKLRSRYIGRRRFYLGRDLLAWLSDERSCEICGYPLANSTSPTAKRNANRCLTCTNYR